MKSRLKLIVRLMALILIGCLVLPLLPWLRKRTTGSLPMKKSLPGYR